MKNFFTISFSEDTTLNTRYLSRYTFVPSQPIGECTKSHLQTLLYRQKLFQKNIQHFIVLGLQNIDQPHQLLDHTDTPVDATSHEEDEQMDTSEGARNSNAAKRASLKWYLYQVAGPSHEALVHAVYPSVDRNRTYILYHPDRKTSTLHLLHT